MTGNGPHQPRAGRARRPHPDSRATTSGTDRSITTTFGGNIALALLGASTGVLAARLLGTAGRGELAAIQTFPTLLAVTAMLGLPEALVFFTARNPPDSGRYLATAMAIVLPVSVVAMAVGY